MIEIDYVFDVVVTSCKIECEIKKHAFFIFIRIAYSVSDSHETFAIH